MSDSAPAGGSRADAIAVRVEAVFHASDEHRARAAATRMIDRAHEIANLGECECDVDVSVEWGPGGEASACAGHGSAAAGQTSPGTGVERVSPPER